MLERRENFFYDNVYRPGAKESEDIFGRKSLLEEEVGTTAGGDVGGKEFGEEVRARIGVVIWWRGHIKSRRRNWIKYLDKRSECKS